MAVRVVITASLFVAAAALGAGLRHVLTHAAPSWGPLPTGTLAANLVGSFVLGLLAGWDPPGATVVGVAGIGALTTFSTFAAQVVRMRDDGWSWVVGYAGASLVGGVSLAWVGLQLA